MQKIIQLTGFQNRVIQSGIILSYLLIFNVDIANAQWIKSVFGPSKKELTAKIDSLQELLSNQSKENDVRIKSIEKKLKIQTAKITTLKKENQFLYSKLDSTQQKIEELLKKELQNLKPQTITSDLFCPDSNIVKKIEVLKECECYKKNLTGAEINEGGFEVVMKGIEMVADSKKIVQGSCWKYINTVYNSTGYPVKKRNTVYKAKKGSRIQNLKLVHPGDWIYHINHSFRNVEHSAIFICWKDYEKKIGITLSHVGQNKARTGQFGAYDLKSIYNIMRPVKE